MNRTALAMIAGPLIAASLALPAQAHVKGDKYEQGVTIQTDPNVPLWNAQTAKLIKAAATSGANTFVITFPLEQDRDDATVIHTRPKSSIERAYTPSDSELTVALHEVVENGMKPVLKPHVELKQSRDGKWVDGNWHPDDSRPLVNGGWRSHIMFTQSQNKQADAWAASYRAWLVHYALLMKQAGSSGSMVLSTEQFGVTLNRYNSGNSKRWITTIAAVRKANPKLRLTMAAYNTGRNTRPNETMLLARSLVAKLDYFSMTYYPINGVPDPTLAHLKEHMALERAGVFDKIHKRYGKDIVVAETGFRGKDPALQGRQYEALLSFLDGVYYVKGVDLYRWLNDPATVTANDDEFQPGAQAMKVQAKYYGGKVPR